jgi:retron-type reverse transcriptase
MKRHGNLFTRVCTFENLLLAARKASRGKRFRDNILTFNAVLEKEILLLQKQLRSQTYRPGSYMAFYIYEPKKRLISAAPFRDRVAHHALCNVIEPIFESGFIFDSYANRKWKGTHRAVDRYTEFSRKNHYVLKCDIKKFFPSMDHVILLEIINRKIKCPETLWLIRTIIEGSNPQEPVLDYYPGDDLFTPVERRKGLPIGNLTSQFFANIYLSPLDHFVKERLRCRYYIRYVDDFVIFSDEKEQLWEIMSRIGQFLDGLRLRLHPKKCFVVPVPEGMDFLGYRVFPTHRRIRAETLRRFLKRLRNLYRECRADLSGLLDRKAEDSPYNAVRASLAAWLGHAMHADTFRLREKLEQ